MASSEKERFRDFLRGEGLKLTRERCLVLEEVFRNHTHFEADDIVMGLRKRDRRVSRASVYRTLPLLVKSGLLRDVHSSEKHSHYEHVFGHHHHDHLICTECGQVIEFTSPMIERLQDEVCNRHGFLAVTHKLEITGLCDVCRSRQAQGSAVDRTGS